MKFQILICVTILTSSRSQSNIMVDQNLGIALERQPEKELKFYSHYETIVYDRIYFAACNNVPQFEVMLALQDFRCRNFKSDIVKGNLRKFQSACVKAWKSKMHSVITYDKPRQKRSVSLFVGAISALSMLIGAVKNTIELSQMAKRIRDFEKRNNRILTDINENQINVAALSSYVSSDLDRLSSALCGRTLEDTLRNCNNLANIMIDSYLDHITRETLSISSGQIPNNIDFVMDLKSICNQFNSKDFCLQAINDRAIKIQFETAALDSDMSLHITMKVELPINSPKFKNSRPIKISNVGFHRNDKYYKLNLPDSALETNGKTYGFG